MNRQVRIHGQRRIPRIIPSPCARVHTPHPRQGRAARQRLLLLGRASRQGLLRQGQLLLQGSYPPAVAARRRRPSRARCARVKRLAGGIASGTQGCVGSGLGPGSVGERRKLLEIGGRRGRRLPACHGGGGGAQAAGRPAAAAGRRGRKA